MAKTPDEATETMIANLPEKTGKSLDQWLKVLRGTRFEKHGEIVKHLKTAHGVSHGYANLIAHKAMQEGAPETTGDDLVRAQYAGAKAALWPIYERLLAAIQKFGRDVEIATKKAYVSLRRAKQFALIQPSTATRLDVGINLKGVEANERLEASGSFNAMVTHRVRLSEVRDVDAQLVGWLKAAYENAG